ncbi:MAG: hypothetical protein U0T36_10100 [Saprospiraceae bacterium]
MNTFVEVQKFKQWYIWLPFLAPCTIWLYAFVKQVIFGFTVGSRPVSDTEICLIGLLIICPLWLLFWNLKLTTTIDQNTITLELERFTSKIIHLSNVVDYKIIEYHFVGFGWRIGTPYGTVYNCSGNQGVQLILDDGKSIMLGSQRPKDIINFLNSISSKQDIIRL